VRAWAVGMEKPLTMRRNSGSLVLAAGAVLMLKLGTDYGFVTAYPRQAPRTARVQANAGPEFLTSMLNAAETVPTLPAVDLSGIGFHFFLALLPAIIVEIVLLEPTQKLFTQLGWRSQSETRDYVAGSEKSIKVQRPFFLPDWQEHRENPDRYWSSLKNMFGNSSALNRLQGPLLVLNIISAFVLFYSMYLVPQGFTPLVLPLLPFTLSSFALGLLITFRVNTANNRYVLARNKWGHMLNVSRSLVHQGMLWAKDSEKGKDLARWVPAFVAALMCHLRDPSSHDLREELRAAGGPADGTDGDGHGLTEEEIEEIMNRPVGINPGHYVLLRIREKVMNLELGLPQRIRMEFNTDELFDDIGGCENIFATPIPLGYTKHTARFLLLWLGLLPFALEQQLGFGLVFSQQLVAFGLLGIEDIGIQLEEPFSVLPLKRIVSKICLEAQLVRKRGVETARADGVAATAVTA